ncbi:receptor protein kinase-like protein [Thioploca ingrica]|uniref:Receptor protein kinase-like protein n=1 Tax=Thioploca ingrica TaxID=40754 RepID=A0A090AMY9_9GAMM|nr:receptor protein kinase-like protein [Thioploca ingrica]
MKRYISSLFIWLNLFLAVVQAAGWEEQYPSATELQAIWGSAENDVFAVGYGAIFHYDGSSWSEMNTNYYDLRGIWGTSNKNVIAVGRIMGEERSIILYYNGNQWSAMNGTFSWLSGIWGSSDSDVFAVGGNGTTLHYNGNQWTTMNSGTDFTLSDVWGSSSSDVFAVGEGGTILHYDGNQWSTMDSKISTWIHDIWGSSSNDVFAVGEGGTILHYDGKQWTAMNSGISSWVSGIWGSSSSDVFVVGFDGTILYYDGDTWMKMTNRIGGLTTIWLSSEGNIFTAGTNIFYCTNCRQKTKINPSSYDFGNITLGQQISQTFTVSNTGNTDTQFQQFTLANTTDFALNNDTCSNTLLAPANTCQVTVDFQPQMEGNQPTKLTLDSDITTIDIPLTGIASINFQITPRSHDFGEVTLGQPLDQTFTVSNTDNTNIPFQQLSLDNSTDFVLDNDTCSNTLLAPASTCQVTVRFQPQVEGVKSSKLLLLTDTAKLNVLLTGTAKLNFQVTPQSYDFGKISLGQLASQTFTVSNTSNTDIPFQQFTLANTTDFAISNDTCSNTLLTPTNTCQVTVNFQPQSEGIESTKLSLPSNISTTDILLRGTASTDIKVDPQFYNFGNITLGQPVSQTFTISNISNGNAQLQLLTLTNSTNFNLNNDTCSNKSLAPTDTCQVTVNFQPQVEGTQSTKITIPKVTETLQIPIGGTSCSTTFQQQIFQQQAFYLHPKSPNFGTALIGNSLTLNQTVIFIVNQECGELYIDKIEVAGQDAAEFKIEDKQCYSSSYGKESYSYCQFNTVFQPTTAGDKQAELTFKLLDHPELPVPTVALQAKAVKLGQAQLDLTPTEHDFGTVIIGHGSISSSFTIKNTGTANLKVNNINFTLTGDNATEFSWENWWCTALDILPPGTQCDINVWLSPTSAGQKQAHLTLTSGDLTAEALLKGVAEEAKDCSDANITIESIQTGRWDAATTWSTATIPTATDVVRINNGHTVTGQELAQIRTLCVQAGATLESLNDQGTALEIQATDYLENHGLIRGKDGRHETQSACSQANIGTEGCAQPGASVLLKVGTGFDKYGKLGDWWWEGSGGPVLNTGEIIAGKGGDGSQYGAPGGDAIVLGRNNTNAKRIQAGDGGNVLGTGAGEGGRGGLTQIWGKLGGPGNLYVQNGAQALAGKGGNCNPQGQQTGGNGGNLWLVSLPNVYIDGGITEAGIGGQGCARPGQAGFVQIEPNVISLAGAATHVKGGDIAIYGGNDWTLDLSNLSGTVIEASGTLTLAVGKGGLIDFRNSTGQILTAKEVQIFTDNLLIDSGKKISDYIAAENIVIGPSKILRNVSLTVASKLFGNPGEVLSIPLVIANNGPEDDNYTLTVKDSAGNILNQLAAVEVKGLDIVNLAIDLTIPASNKVIFTAVSQADQEVSSTSEVILTTIPVVSSDGNQVAPDGNKPASNGNPVTPAGNQSEQESNEDKLISNNNVIVVEQPTLNSCHVTPDGIIDWTCINKEQILTDVTLESNAKISGGQLAGTIDNQGFVSQVTIQPDTLLKGGKLSGYIVNQGTLMDFEFVGVQVTGGTLAGQIINNSLMGGVFKDVHLAADTHLLGGYLQGEIQGDPAAPALLEDLTIQSGSHLAYVKIGKNVTWSAEVVFEDNVQFVEPTTYCNPTRLADIVPLLPRLDTMVLGKSIEVCSQFGGGLATDGKLFQQQLTVTRADLVEVMGRIAPDLRQVSQVVDLVLSAAYRAVETEPPLYFMVDTRGKVLPWDGDVSDLVAFKEQVTLESVQSLRLYRGKFPAKGKLEIQFGYRLADGTVVLNAQPLEVMVLE